MESNNDLQKSGTTDTVSNETNQTEPGQDPVLEFTATQEPGQSLEPQSYEQLVEQVTQINTKLDTMTNLFIVTMVGVGIIAGILCNQIFSRYFSS